MSKLPKFGIDGTIHIITNNQLGFTTNAEDGRSFDHSADIVKSFGVPIIRINAADARCTPESLIKICRFMIDYWRTFKKDILIDMIGFRKYGHNEVDEPGFTQPHMYKKIRGMTTTLAQDYAARLVEEGVITQEEVESLKTEINSYFESEFQKSKEFVPQLSKTKDPKYKGSRAFTHKWADLDFS